MMADDGADGDQGPPGATGPTGAQGIQGNTGAQGPNGPALFMLADDGLDGNDGNPGAPGLTGKTGGSGPAGPAIFLDAEPGADGDPGPTGARGPAGANGANGIQGFNGPPGDDGADGDSISFGMPTVYPGGNLTVNGAAIFNTGGIAINAPIAPPLASSLYIHGYSNGNAIVALNSGSPSEVVAIIAGSVASNSFGLLIEAGTNSSDYALSIANGANTEIYAQINGDGSGQLGYNGSTGVLTWNAAGSVTINAPASGNALSIYGVSNSPALYMQPVLAGSPANLDAQEAIKVSLAAGIAGLTFASGDARLITTTIAPNNYIVLRAYTVGLVGSVGLGLWANGYGSSTPNLGISAAGNVTISAPSSGQPLAITGIAAGTAALTINTAATTGAQTASFTATNKPGAATQTTPTKWIPVILDGTTYYLPAFS
ncbi:MAG: hypothetical protein ACLQFI_18330 [Methylocella sp.]